jgi:phosphoglycolate phosphatase
MKRTEAILFDLDGVLIDSYQAWFKLLNAAAVANGYPGIDEDKYQILFGQSVESDIDILFPGMKPEALVGFFQQHFFDYLDDFHTIPVADESVELVRELGMRSSVVTNTSTPLARAILEHIDLKPDHVVGNGDVENDKPAPDMVLKACEDLEVSTKNAALVGDSDFDERAAAGASVLFIGFKRPGAYSVRSHADLQKLLREEFSG